MRQNPWTYSEKFYVLKSSKLQVFIIEGKKIKKKKKTNLTTIFHIWQTRMLFVSGFVPFFVVTPFLPS